MISKLIATKLLENAFIESQIILENNGHKNLTENNLNKQFNVFFFAKFSKNMRPIKNFTRNNFDPYKMCKKKCLYTFQPPPHIS